MTDTARVQGAVVGPEPGVGAALRRRWRTGVAVGVCLAVLGGSAAFLLPQRWEATAIVSFTPRLEAAISPDTVALVAQRYAVQVTSDAAAEEVAEAAGIPGDALSQQITTQLETGTGNLRITVVLDEREQAVAAANQAAADVVERAATDDLVAPDLSAAATERAATMTPPRSLLVIATLAAAVIIGLLAAIVDDRFGAALRRSRAADKPVRAPRAVGSSTITSGASPGRPTVAAAPAPVPDAALEDQPVPGFEQAVQHTAGSSIPPRPGLSPSAPREDRCDASTSPWGAGMSRRQGNR